MENMPPSFIEEILDKVGVVIDTTPLKVSSEPQIQVWDDLVEKLVSQN